MNFTLIDFLIGFFLMNAMPHLIFSLIKQRFLSLFGFSPSGNLAYAFINITVALILFHSHYGILELLHHGIVVGALIMFILHLILDKFFYNLFQKTG